MNSFSPNQAVVKSTLIFLKGKVYRFFFLIPLEIFSELILANSTTNQTKLFHGNSTPSWLKKQHDKEVYNSASRQWAPYGFWPKMRTKPWEGVLTDKKAMKFYVFHYTYNKINIKYRRVCVADKVRQLLSCQWLQKRVSRLLHALQLQTARLNLLMLTLYSLSPLSLLQRSLCCWKHYGRFSWA